MDKNSREYFISMRSIIMIVNWDAVFREKTENNMPRYLLLSKLGSLLLTDSEQEKYQICP